MARQEYLPHCHRPILSAHGSGITGRWYADNNHNIKALQINVHLAFNVAAEMLQSSSTFVSSSIPQNRISHTKHQPSSPCLH